MIDHLERRRQGCFREEPQEWAGGNASTGTTPTAPPPLLESEHGFIARGSLGSLVGRWFAFGWVGKQQPAYSDSRGDGKVPDRTTRKRASEDGDDQASDDTCQQPGQPLEVDGRCHSRRARRLHGVQLGTSTLTVSRLRRRARAAEAGRLDRVVRRHTQDGIDGKDFLQVRSPSPVRHEPSQATHQVPASIGQGYPKKHPYSSFCTTARKSSIAATAGVGS